MQDEQAKLGRAYAIDWQAVVTALTVVMFLAIAAVVFMQMLPCVAVVALTQLAVSLIAIYLIVRPVRAKRRAYPKPPDPPVEPPAMRRTLRTPQQHIFDAPDTSPPAPPDRLARRAKRANRREKPVLSRKFLIFMLVTSGITLLPAGMALVVAIVPELRYGFHAGRVGAILVTLILAVVPPVLFLIAVIRTPRYLPRGNTCGQCGYELRGLRHSRDLTCPECGWRVYE